MNFWQLIAFASTLLSALESQLAAIQSGQPATAPGIHTYIFGKHVEVDITIKPL